MIFRTSGLVGPMFSSFHMEGSWIFCHVSLDDRKWFWTSTIIIWMWSWRCVQSMACGATWATSMATPVTWREKTWVDLWFKWCKKAWESFAKMKGRFEEGSTTWMNLRRIVSVSQFWQSELPSWLVYSPWYLSIAVPSPYDQHGA